MCGRYGQNSRKERLEELLGLKYSTGGDKSAKYNIAPGTYPLIVRSHGESGTWFEGYHWGLIPSWTKDLKAGPHPINARAETASTKPMFKRLLSANRCLVPADGYYEWKRTPTGKIPHWIKMADESPFFFAGLWDWWHENDPDGIPSFTILTTDANELTMPIHNRMPVIVRKQDYNLWLDPQATDTSKVSHVLRPYDGREMAAYPVSTKVNNVKNDGPDLIKPIP